MFKVPFSESWTAIKPAVEAIRNYDIHMLTSRKLNCCFFYFAILVNVFFLQKNKSQFSVQLVIKKFEAKKDTQWELHTIST